MARDITCRFYGDSLPSFSITLYGLLSGTPLDNLPWTHGLFELPRSSLSLSLSSSLCEVVLFASFCFSVNTSTRLRLWNLPKVFAAAVAAVALLCDEIFLASTSFDVPPTQPNPDSPQWVGMPPDWKDFRPPCTWHVGHKVKHSRQEKGHPFATIALRRTDGEQEEVGARGEGKCSPVSSLFIPVAWTTLSSNGGGATGAKKPLGSLPFYPVNVMTALTRPTGRLVGKCSLSLPGGRKCHLHTPPLVGRVTRLVAIVGNPSYSIRPNRIKVWVPHPGAGNGTWS